MRTTNTSMGVDTFICGDCNEKFFEINEFVAHKNAGCSTLPKQEDAGEGLKEEVQIEIIPEQTGTVTVQQPGEGDERKELQEQMVVANDSSEAQVSTTVVEMVDDATVRL